MFSIASVVVALKAGQGALVHCLGAGGVAVPEAAWFAAIMAGAGAQAPDDDALLQAMSTVLLRRTS